MKNFRTKEKRNGACPVKPGRSSGFTLVETLVALFIFSISIMSVMAVLSQGISNTEYAKNKMTAEYLSQEGVEYIRNMRDTFMLYAPDKAFAWGEFSNKLLEEGKCENGCRFDPDESLLNTGQLSFIKDIKMIPCDGKCPNFLYNTSTGQFDFSGGAGTNFSRTIRVKKDTDDNNLKITSEVTFSAGSSKGTISLSEDLSNWIE